MTASDYPDISLRLGQVLRVYCAQLDPSTLADLHDAIGDGRYPWFREEFADAVRRAVFTPSAWHEVVSTRRDHPFPGEAAEEARVIREQQRIWRTLFAEQEFPAPRLTRWP